MEWMEVAGWTSSCLFRHSSSSSFAFIRVRSNNWVTYICTPSPVRLSGFREILKSARFPEPAAWGFKEIGLQIILQESLAPRPLPFGGDGVILYYLWLQIKKWNYTLDKLSNFLDEGALERGLRLAISFLHSPNAWTKDAFDMMWWMGK